MWVLCKIRSWVLCVGLGLGLGLVMLGFEKDMGLRLRVLECLDFQTNFFFKVFLGWRPKSSPILAQKPSKSHLNLVQYAYEHPE